MTPTKAIRRSQHAISQAKQLKGHNTLTESFKTENTAVGRIFSANTAITGGGIE